MWHNTPLTSAIQSYLLCIGGLMQSYCSMIYWRNENENQSHPQQMLALALSSLAYLSELTLMSYNRPKLTDGEEGDVFKLRAVLQCDSCACSIDYETLWMGLNIFYEVRNSGFVWLAPNRSDYKPVYVAHLLLGRYWSVMLTSVCQQTPLFDMQSAIKWSTLTATRYIVNGRLFKCQHVLRVFTGVC